MTEQQIQKKISDHLEADGWMVVKLIKTNCNGIPDLMALRNGVTKFIEVKRPKVGRLSKIQDFRIRQLKEYGFDVEVWEGIEKKFKKKVRKCLQVLK